MSPRALWAWVFVSSCDTQTTRPDVVLDTDSSAGTTPDLVDPRVTAGPAILCPDPSSRSALGPLIRSELGAEWWADAGVVGGKGVNVEDFDGDGHLDLFVPQSGGASKLLAGDGAGGFTIVSATAFPLPLEDVAGASTVDFDADGDVDIIAYGFTSPLQLLRNDGAGVFAVEDLPSPPGCGGSASLADMDLDGDLDLFHGRLNGAIDGLACDSVLLENVGGGTLVDVSDRIPGDVHRLKVMSSGWLQLDVDPLPELYVVSDLPQRNDGNAALDNQTAGGPLVQMSFTGLEVDLAGMGLGIGDLNDDGVWDVVVPAINKIAVLVSLPATGVWIDQAAVYGIVPDREDGQSWGWGAEVDDLDNDGLSDVAVGFGPTRKPDPEHPLQPDEIYRNNGDGTFERVAEAWGAADTLSMRGFVFTDFDHDGWLDIVKRESGGRIVLYQSRCGTDHWIEVALEGTGENLRGIGATVRVEVAGVGQLRPIVAGSTGYNSGGPPIAHFGLGAADHVDGIEVTWPDGAITHHPPIAADQRLTIRYAPDDEVSPTAP